MTDAEPVAGEAGGLVVGTVTVGVVPGETGATWVTVDPGGGKAFAGVLVPAD